MIMDLFSFLMTTPGTFLLISSFILFIFLIKKAISIIIQAGIVTIASAAFPFIANYVGLTALLGVEVSPSLDSAIFFVTIGLVAYFLFLVGRTIYSLLGFVDKKKKVVKVEKVEKSS